MNILLVSMPDSFEHMPTVGIRMPNGALSSLAGNLDPHHRVAVADLILAQGEVRTTVERLVREWSPDLVGLSVMTFQRRTALDIIQLVRALRPGVRIVVGGYDPSLAPEAYTEPQSGVDFIVRGEGELTCRALVRSLDVATASKASPACRSGPAMDSSTTPTARPRVYKIARYGGRTVTPGSWGATRSSDARWTSWRPRAAARSTAASARSSRCAAATSTPTSSSESWTTSATRVTTAPGPSSSWTTTSR